MKYMCVLLVRSSRAGKASDLELELQENAV
jgi:hypothetical protein